MDRLTKNVLLCHIKRRFIPSSLGRSNCDPSILLDYMLLVLQSGMAWRHLQFTKCPYDYRTVHQHFRQWSKHSIFKDAYASIFRLYSRRRRCKYHCIDSSYVKNIYGHDCTGRNPTDRGRRATKVSAIVDDIGVPVALFFCAGNVSDHKTILPTLNCIIKTASNRIPLYADKGYDSEAGRRLIRSYNYIDRVAKRRVRTHRVVNRKRGIVERVFSWFDKYRRLLLRYDALVISYENWTYLAACRLLGNKMKKI